MENKPIKRNEHMVTLSHDHHAGLLFCWKIRQGLINEAPLSKILAYINFFWSQHLKEHFQEEEILLFNRLGDVLSRQGISEHLMLTRQLEALNHEKSENAAKYASFAESLTRHIRFEERILFPFLEKSLPESTLKSVGTYLKEKHPSSFEDNYADEFWSKNYNAS